MEITTISVGRDVLIAPRPTSVTHDSPTGRARCLHRAASHSRTHAFGLSAIASLGSRGILKYTACALIAAFAIGESGAETGYEIRQSQEFLRWQKLKRLNDHRRLGKMLRKGDPQKPKKLLKANAAQDDLPVVSLGAMPSEFDMNYLRLLNNQSVSRAQRSMGIVLPARYNLAEQGKITPVRDQGSYGTCWAHATVGALESWALAQGEKNPDFSEKHLANTHGWNWEFDDGGTGALATWYLTRWSGPIAEVEDPYPGPEYYEEWANDYLQWYYGYTSFRKYASLQDLIPKSPVGTPIAHVQNVRVLPPMADASDTRTIKEWLYRGLPLYVNYQHVEAAYTANYKTFYWDGNGSSDGGHAVLLVGWDDNYSRTNFKNTPPGDGAFIAKNSWGTSLCDAGYFYVSYHDAKFGRGELYSFTYEPVDNYQSIYQHDLYGWRALLDKLWGANVFTATKNESVSAVGIWAFVPDSKYTIYVYTGLKNASDPRSGTLISTQSGSFDEAGFYTIPLETEAPIRTGEKFAVVVKFDNVYAYCDFINSPRYMNISLAVEMASYNTPLASAGAGQSFYSSNGSSWTDFTKGYNSTANFICKAYTKSSAAPAKSLSSVAISGVSSLAVGNVANFTCTAKYSDGSSKDVTQSAVWSSSSTAASVSQGKVTAKPVDAQTTVTIKAGYTEGGVTTFDSWGMYVTVGKPGAPTGVSATRGTDASCVRVTWTAPSGASSYTVYRGSTSSSANASYLGAVTTTRYSDTTAKPGVKYYYFVKAKNDSGTGAFSAGAQGWRALAAPTDVTASDGTSLDGVNIRWNEVEGAKFYRVYRANSYSGSKTALGSWQSGRTYTDETATAGTTYYYFVTAATDSSGTMESDYSIFDDGYKGVPVTLDYLTINGSASISAGGNATYTCTATYTDKSTRSVSPTWSITAGADYVTRSGATLTAKAVSDNQSVTLRASYSDGVTRTTTKTITIKAVKPSAPANVWLSSTTASGIAIGWDAVGGASSYRIYRSVNGGSYALLTTVTDTSYTDGSAAPGATCTYAVAAVNGAGESARSGATASGVLPLAAPGGLSASKGLYTDKVTLTWQPVVGATHYHVYRATSATGSKTALGDWQTGTAYEDKSGTAGTTYCYFVVAATSSAGANPSAYSAAAQGMKKKPVSSVSITGGTERLLGGRSWVFGCTATYGDGSTVTARPTWSVEPSTYAQIDADGRLTTSAVTADQTLTVTATYTDGATVSQTFTVKLTAPTAVAAEVKNVSAAVRWPFSNLLDVDYEVAVEPSGSKVNVSLSGYDADRRQTLAAKTLTGDGANGPVEAGPHRLTWNVAADHPGLRSSALSVAMEATPGVEPVTVRFDANGGSCAESPWERIPGEKYGTLPTASRSAYTLAGWYTAASGGTKVTSTSVIPEDNIVLYAHWTAVGLSAPTGVSATDGTSTTGTTISWNAVMDATKYYIYRYTSSSSSSASSIGSTSSTSYTDTTGTAGKTYYYWVKAYRSDNGQYSSFSSYDTGYRKQTIALSTALDNSSLTFTTGGSAEWYGVSDTSYDGTDSACSGVITGSQTSWLQTTVTGPGTFSFRWRVSSESSYDKLIFYIDGTSQATISGTDMTSFALKTYEIASGSHTLKWEYSKDGSVDRGSDCGWVDCVSYSRVYAPSAPTGVSASDGTYTSDVTISWSAVSGATSYEVYRYTSSSSSYASYLGSTSNTYYYDTSATPGKTYYYWVKAVNSAGSSSFSSYDTGYRKQDSLSAPTNVSATDGTSAKSTTISWSAVSGATRYYVYRYTSNNSSSATQIGSSTSTSYTDTTGTAGTTYYYWVKAYNDGLYSLFSSYDTGYRRTPAAALPAPSNLTGTINGFGMVTLIFSRVSGAVSYGIYRSTGPELITVGTTMDSSIYGSTIHYLDSLSYTGKGGWYYVTSINADGEETPITKAAMLWYDY